MAADLALTAAGNAVLAGSAVLVAGLIVFQAATDPVRTRWGRVFMHGAALAAISVALRIGFWLVAIWGRVPPEAYAGWHVDWRAPLAGVSSVLWVAGVTMMAAGALRRGSCWRWAGIALVWSAAMAGLGYWGAL